MPVGDRDAISVGLTGVMGSAPTTVRPGLNAISEYPNGTQDDANKVFDSFPLSNVHPIDSSYGDWGRAGTLPNGTTVIVRPSKDGRPTIQIIDVNRPNGNSRSIAEIRFGKIK